MSAQNQLVQFLTALLTSSPYLLVLLIGFVWSLVAMSQHPKPALLVAFGTALLLGNIVILTAAHYWGLPIFASGRGSDDVRIFVQTLGVVRSAVSAAGLGLVLIACFVDRTPAHRSGK